MKNVDFEFVKKSVFNKFEIFTYIWLSIGQKFRRLRRANLDKLARFPIRRPPRTPHGVVTPKLDVSRSRNPYTVSLPASSVVYTCITGVRAPL